LNRDNANLSFIFTFMIEYSENRLVLMKDSHLNGTELY
jgi:hypothetical protein